MVKLSQSHDISIDVPVGSKQAHRLAKMQEHFDGYEALTLFLMSVFISHISQITNLPRGALQSIQRSTSSRPSIQIRNNPPKK